ncbi:UNVERIFIED_CONTAM: hypothetical protein FKN15_033126 [Acipenser sinensis]
MNNERAHLDEKASDVNLTSHWTTNPAVQDTAVYQNAPVRYANIRLKTVPKESNKLLNRTHLDFA